jgi:hypothetical protein
MEGDSKRIFGMQLSPKKRFYEISDHKDFMPWDYLLMDTYSCHLVKKYQVKAKSCVISSGKVIILCNP